MQVTGLVFCRLEIHIWGTYTQNPHTATEPTCTAYSKPLFKSSFEAGLSNPGFPDSNTQFEDRSQFENSLKILSLKSFNRRYLHQEFLYVPLVRLKCVPLQPKPIRYCDGLSIYMKRSLCHKSHWWQPINPHSSVSEILLIITSSFQAPVILSETWYWKKKWTASWYQLHEALICLKDWYMLMAGHSSVSILLSKGCQTLAVCSFTCNTATGKSGRCWQRVTEYKQQFCA